jgi:hypothetical protein
VLRTKATSASKKRILVTLVYVALAIAIFLGFNTGWLDLQGRPIQDIWNLHVPVEEENRQIDGPLHPHPQATER